MGLAETGRFLDPLDLKEKGSSEGFLVEDVDSTTLVPRPLRASKCLEAPCNSILETGALVQILTEPLTMQSQESCITSWDFDFPACKMGMIILPVSLYCFK